MLTELLSAHDPYLFLAAFLVSLIGCQLGFLLLPPHDALRSRMAIARTILAGVWLGATSWFVFRLSLAAYFPFLTAGIPGLAAATSVVLGVVGATAATAIVVFGDLSVRNALLAASILSSSGSCMLFASMSGLAAPLVLGYALLDVLEAMVVATAICALGLWRFKRSPSRRGAVAAAGLVSLALPALDLGSLYAILPFTDWEVVSATSGALALRPLTVVFASEFVAALLLVRAGAVVDRQSMRRATAENQRLRQLTESTFEGIVVHRRGRVVDANQAYCALLQLPLDAVIGRTMAELAPGFRNGPCPQPVELDLMTAGGERIPVEMLSRSLSLGAGDAEVTAVRDIRERRAAERSARDRQRAEELQREADEQRERRRIAEQASRAKSAFLAMMSHEIRTPMNAVLGLASSLLEEALSSEQHQTVVAIRDSGDALLRILNDVLDFSKLDAGRMTFEAAPFSPSALAHDALSVYRPHAATKGLAIRLETDAALPDSLLGDAGRIRQVLYNLVSNAVKFTEVGEILITVRCAAQSADSATMEWAVRDTGIGIVTEKLGTLFDAFVQADDSITRRFGGSGLGLAISRQIVEGMGGTIGVHSTLGQGSRFRFCLKLPRAQDALHPEAVDPEHAAELLQRHIAELARPLQILLAEDNPTNQFVMGRLLKGFAVQLDIANDGLQAVAAARSRHYDMICMDMRMPEMDGLEATRAIRREAGPSQRVPIVAMTANAFPEDIEACRAAGMDDFVAKPVSKSQLVSAILRALSKGAPVGAGTAADPAQARVPASAA